ncbi:MAG: transposase [Actinobacteria bacterium]|nr:transposase [Actinomycetota bacterium]
MKGAQYTALRFTQRLLDAGVTQSMGRTGSALDNAVAESFNSTLQFELLGDQHFATRELARRAVAGWIDEYNTVRRHSTDHMLSPRRLRTHPRPGTRPDAGWSAGGMSSPSPQLRRSNDNGGGFAAADLSHRAAQGTGPPLPASRVATAIATRRPTGRP